MTMKVALAAPYFHPHIGGVESHVMALAKELLKKGHRVAVFTSMHDPALETREEVEGIDVRRIPMRALLFQTPMTPRLVGEIHKEDWDVIHSHSPPPLTAYFAAKASKRSGTPLVHTHHCDPQLPSMLGRMVTSVYNRTLLASTLRRASRIIVYTESYAATSLAIWKYPTVCVPTGLDIDRFGPQADGAAIRERHRLEDRKVVLFVGRLTEHKGIQTLIEAAPMLPRDTAFLLVGPGEIPRAWTRLMRQLGVEDRFLKVGKVPEHELPAYYSACDILVLPSVSRLEAFGLVLVEAMASGKPVVASDIPGVRDVVMDGQTGFLAEPFMARDLADKLNAIISDDELAAQMGRKARIHAREHYSWNVIGDIIERVYMDVISEKGHKPPRPEH
jgi:glycosyltransferase involved in cell wall biosynthesis